MESRATWSMRPKPTPPIDAGRSSMTTVDSLHEQWLDAYSDQIGRARDEVTTPALLLDLDKANRNIATMAAKFRELPAELRPHIKVHKSPQLARLEVESGAVGVACATAWEALVMAQSGIDDVLIANQVVHPDKLRAVMDAARLARLTIAVDDPRNVDQLSAGAIDAGVELELLIEIDVGMGRCGVRTKEQALALAEHAAGKPGLRLRGMQGYEGHCMLEPDQDIRFREARAANAKLVEAVDLLARARIPVGRRLRGRHRHLFHHRREPAHHRGAGRLVHAHGLLPRAARPRRLRGRPHRARNGDQPPGKHGRPRRRPQVGRDRLRAPTYWRTTRRVRSATTPRSTPSSTSPALRRSTSATARRSSPATDRRPSTSTTCSTWSRTMSSPTSGLSHRADPVGPRPSRAPSIRRRRCGS